MLYIVAKLQAPSFNTFRDMNFFLVTDGGTESDAYEPTVHKHRWAQKLKLSFPLVKFFEWARTYVASHTFLVALLFILWGRHRTYRGAYNQ